MPRLPVQDAAEVYEFAINPFEGNAVWRRGLLESVVAHALNRAVVPKYASHVRSGDDLGHAGGYGLERRPQPSKTYGASGPGRGASAVNARRQPGRVGLESWQRVPFGKWHMLKGVRNGMRKDADVGFKQAGLVNQAPTPYRAFNLRSSAVKKPTAMVFLRRY